MPDEPIVTPAAEPAATPAAEPADTPAAEPAATPAAEPAAAPAGTYPVETPPEPKPAGAAHSTYMGQSFEMSQDQLDQIVHAGLTAIEQQKATTSGATPAAAQLAAEPGGDDEVAQLKTAFTQLQTQVNAGNYEARVQNETSRINQSLDAEISNHEVFKDNPDLTEVGRKSALALLNHNPRMTEAEAMKSVANDFGAALNKKKDQWVQGKMQDAASAEAGPGGQPSATPPGKQQTGKDLMHGRVRDRAMARLANTQLIT